MDVMWDAKYEARGKLQLAIEVTILFCIINTASCIHNIQELQENGQTWCDVPLPLPSPTRYGSDSRSFTGGRWWFCFFSMAILSMWMLRYLMVRGTRVALPMFVATHPPLSSRPDGFHVRETERTPRGRGHGCYPAFAAGLLGRSVGVRIVS